MPHTDKNDNEELDNTLFEQFEEIVNGLGLVKNQIVNLQQNLKQLEKILKKQMKVLKKEKSYKYLKINLKDYLNITNKLLY